MDELIGTLFENKCPVCKNKQLYGGDCVYDEQGDSFWEYYKWKCFKCGTTILEEVTIDITRLEKDKREDVDWKEMTTCPRCGSDVGTYDDNRWYPEEGIRDVNHLYFTCPECGVKYTGKEIYNSFKSSVYALRDKYGNVQMSSSFVGKMDGWFGQYTEKYLRFLNMIKNQFQV